MLFPDTISPTLQTLSQPARLSDHERPVGAHRWILAFAWGAWATGFYSLMLLSFLLQAIQTSTNTAGRHRDAGIRGAVVESQGVAVRSDRRAAGKHHVGDEGDEDRSEPDSAFHVHPLARTNDCPSAPPRLRVAI